MNDEEAQVEVTNHQNETGHVVDRLAMSNFRFRYVCQSGDLMLVGTVNTE